MEKKDPFAYPLRRMHFFKRYELDDYPIHSTFGFAGNAFMGIFVDNTRKVIVNWPLNLDFVPKNYSPEAYILLHYLNADAPPVLYAEERVDMFSQTELDDLDRFMSKYMPVTNQIALTLPRMTTDSIFRSL